MHCLLYQYSSFRRMVCFFHIFLWLTLWSSKASFYITSDISESLLSLASWGLVFIMLFWDWVASIYFLSHPCDILIAPMSFTSIPNALQKVLIYILPSLPLSTCILSPVMLLTDELLVKFVHISTTFIIYSSQVKERKNSPQPLLKRKQEQLRELKREKEFIHTR